MVIATELIKKTYIYFIKYENNSPLAVSIKNDCKEYVKNHVHKDILDIIEDTVSNYYNIPIKVLQLKSKKREIVQTRQIEMYFAIKYTKIPSTQIGIRFGNKEHATVLHAVKVINNLIDTDIEVRNDIRNLRILIEDLITI